MHDYKREREREKKRESRKRRGWRIIANILLIYLYNALDIFGGATKIANNKLALFCFNKIFYNVNWDISKKDMM